MLANPELTQTDACDQVGINERTFRRWREHSSDTINQIQRTIHEHQTEELAKIIQARSMILPSVLRDALSPLTDPSTRLRIYESITRQQDELADKVRSLEHNIDPELFSGPKLETKESRFASPTVDVTVKDGQVSVQFRENPIIEVQALEQSPKESE